MPSSELVCPSGAIVALTYDDGLASQLDTAVPALDKHGLRGTFFINGIADETPWRALVKSGHEVASHTVAHPCSRSNSWVPAGNANEDYDMARMAADLDDTIVTLQSLGQPKPFSFAYPCGTTWVDETHESYIPLVKERFVAARGVAGQVVTQLDDPFNVPAYFMTGSAGSFIELVESAVSQNGLVVFGFHGVGGDHLAVSAADHAALLAYLDSHRDTVSTIPFGQAVQCMMRR